MNEQELVSFYLDAGVLVSPELLHKLKDFPLPLKTRFSVINSGAIRLLNSHSQISIDDFEKALVMKEKRKNSKLYDTFMEYIVKSEEEKKDSLISKETSGETIDKSSDKIISEQFSADNTPSVRLNSASNIAPSQSVSSSLSSQTTTSQTASSQTIHVQNAQISQAPSRESIRADLLEKLKEETKIKEEFMKKNKIHIVSSYNTKVRKWAVHDFVELYQSRFKELEKILRSRQELQNLTSISKLLSKKERENVAIVGLVYEKGLTKAGNIMLTIEDPGGMIKVVVNKTKEDLFRMAEEIQLDEMIGVSGMFDNILFANSIFIPDVPLTKELKKSPEEGYILIISDTQVGNKLFLEKEFEKFLSWINEEIGNDKQRDVASKVKYIFVAGDLVEGVGIYPDQEYDLSIIDIRKQYEAVAKLFSKIPQHIPIIFCLGNHDVGRMSEPQPPLTPEYAAPLLELPNLVAVSNPSTINVFAQPENGFGGIDVMLYHGGSFFYVLNNVMSIRKNGSYKRSDLIMKYLLQRRHLAPTHTSTLYIPDPKKDPLLIDKVPDVLVSGHIHRATVSNYRNVTCINASCWTAKSPEQERRGLEPQPARAFLIDMHTREVKVMNFLSREDQEKEQGTPLASDAGEKKDG